MGCYYLNTWLKTWEHSFGKEQMRVCIYDGEDVLPMFEKCIDFDATMHLNASPGRANTRLSLAYHHALRYLAMTGFSQKRTQKLTRSAIRRYRCFTDVSEGLLGCSPEILWEIRERSSWENHLAASSYFSRAQLFEYSAICSPARVPTSRILFALVHISLLYSSKDILFFLYMPFGSLRLLRMLWQRLYISTVRAASELRVYKSILSRLSKEIYHLKYLAIDSDIKIKNLENELIKLEKIKRIASKIKGIVSDGA